MTVYRCTATGLTPQGETWVTGLWIEKIGGTISDAGAAWHAAFDLLWLGAATPTDSIKQLMHTTTTCTETVVNSLDASFRHNVEQVRTTETLAGTSTAENLPPQTSAVVSLRTALPTRRGRGRMYLPPMTADAEITTGLIDATSLAEISLAAKGMLESLITSTYLPVVAHRDIASTTNLTACDVSNIFGTQRRRRNKLVATRSIRIL
jgi:hypothetical protein